MSETPPTRRPLATFLRATPAAPSLIPTPVAPTAAPPEQPLPVPTSKLPPAPSPELAAAPLAPIVPSPAAPLMTPPRIDVARADTTTPRRDDGKPAAGYATPDRPGWNTLSTRDVPGDMAEGTTVGADDNRDPLSRSPGTQPTGAAVGSIADAGQETDRDLDFDRDPTATANTASTPASDTDPQTDTEATVSDAVHASTTNAAQFQLLPAAASASPAPTFARRGLTRPRLRASGWQWALLIGLVGLLALQIVIADGAHLATNARWRPLVGAACGVLRCTLPAWREPAALTLLNRDVRPLPANPSVLRIQASFRNDARWAQAWPWLQLSLSDADGRVIGTRVLAPQEYLGQRPEAHDTLAPGQAVQVTFRVREPAASTAAFRLDFR